MRVGVQRTAWQCCSILRHGPTNRTYHSRWLNSNNNYIRRETTHGTVARASLDQLDGALDDHLSKRPLALDPQGYFIISIDRQEQCIIAEHYGNTINEKGLACDEETGEVIGCGGASQVPRRHFSGRTAKELSVKILEEETGLCSHLEHANYLGREFQKAECALLTGAEYIQD